MSTAVRGEARRGVILDAVLRVVARDGADALTHRRVAAEAGLPVAATTYWFASKDELLTEAYRLAAERDMERIRTAAQSDGDDLVAKLADVMGAELAQGRTAIIASFQLWFEATRHPGLAEIERAWCDAYTETTRELLAAAGSPDPDVDAPLVVAAIDGLLLSLLTRGGDGIERVYPQLQRLVAALVP